MAQTVDRIISSFDVEKQNEVKSQLSQVIEVIISQRLLPSSKEGTIVACELMVKNDAISNLIREGKAHMIDNVINTSAQYGMISMEKSIASLVTSGLVTVEDGLKYSAKPGELRRLIDKK